MNSFLLVITSSILFFLSHPNFIFENGLGFLIFFAYAPIFVLCSRNSKSPARCFLYGVLWAFLSYGLFGYWLFTYSPFLFFVTIIWFSIFYGAAFWAMARLCCHVERSRNIYGKDSSTSVGMTKWSVAMTVKLLIFLFFEFIKTKGDFGFSYGTAVYAVWKIAPLVKLSSVVGIWGIEALILAVNVTVARLCCHVGWSRFCHAEPCHVERSESEVETSFSASLVVLLLLLSLILGSILIHFENKMPTSGKTTKIALIQNNSDPWIYDIDYYEKDILEMERLASKAIEKTPEIEIVVFPETAVVPSIIKNYFTPIDEKRKSIVSQFLNFMNSYENVTFVVGNGNDGYNSSLVFTGGKNCIPPEPEIYNKNHLVPLSEFLPWYFSFLKPVMEKLNVTLWKKGESAVVFDTGKIKFSTPICFEDTFPTVCKKMKKSGSELFVTMTNDAWSKSKTAQKQHLSMAVFRSAENGVPTVRSTVSGATCLIDKNGRVVQELAHFEKGVLVVEVGF